GLVKPRLAKTIGPQMAASAYRHLTEILLSQLCALRTVELRYTPDDALTEIQAWLRNGWTAHPQGEGDLGARMHRSFEEAFAGGAERVVIIGSDCPTITAADIQSAWNGLASHDLVIGPARDGGYRL